MRNGASLLGGSVSECIIAPPPINDSIIARYDANCWDGVTWSDLSGNGNDLIQRGVQPLPVYFGSEFSGNGGLVFDTAELMSSNTGIGDALNGLSDCTIYLVVRNIDVTTTLSVLLDIKSNSDEIVISDDEDHYCYNYFVNSTINDVVPFDPSLHETEQVRMFTLNSTSGVSEVGYSGDLKVSNPETQTFNMTGGYLFLAHRYTGVNPARCVIAEVLIYGRALNKSELDIMNSHLCSKWGIVDVTPAIDGLASIRNTYDSNLALSATFTAIKGVASNLNDQTSAAWGDYPQLAPWIEAEWASSQTISNVQLRCYSAVTTGIKPAYTDDVDLYWWDGSVWVSAGRYEWYGTTLEIRFNSSINTTKLRFEIGVESANNNHTIREILVY